MFAILLIISMMAFDVFSTLSENKVQSDEKTTLEYVVMRDGNIWEVRDNKSSKATTVVKMADVLITPGGTVRMKDGKETFLNEGDRVTATGTIVRNESNKMSGEQNNPPQKNLDKQEADK